MAIEARLLPTGRAGSPHVLTARELISGANFVTALVRG
jgi:hypothetical protein